MNNYDKALLDGGIRSDLFVPIICKGNGVGLLQVGSYRVAGYTHEDIKTIERLSCQIGIALENARLLSDVEEMFISVVTALSSAIDAKQPMDERTLGACHELRLDDSRQDGADPGREGQTKVLEVCSMTSGR